MATISWRPIALAIGACLLSMASASAQNLSPAMEKSWAFMQKEMPGVSQDVLKAACAEGSVAIYYGTWIDAQESQINHFKETFPCLKVDAFTLQASVLRQRFITEAGANRNIADIIQDTDTGSIDKEVADGLVMKYVISNDRLFANELKKQGYWYPLRLALIGVAWNTQLVNDQEAKVLSEWKGVADPRWKGRAGVVDPSFGGVTFLPWYLWDKQFGESFFQQIGASKPRIFQSTNPASAALASGDIAVLFNASETGLLPVWLAGAPVRWSLPFPGTGPITGQAISARAPHPNAAKLYQEYAFTTDGYGYWQKLGGAPARMEYKDQRKVADESWYKYPASFFNYDPAEATAANQKIIDLFHKYVGTSG